MTTPTMAAAACQVAQAEQIASMMPSRNFSASIDWAPRLLALPNFSLANCFIAEAGGGGMRSMLQHRCRMPLDESLLALHLPVCARKASVQLRGGDDLGRNSPYVQ